MKAAAFAFSTRGRYERAQKLARRGSPLARGAAAAAAVGLDDRARAARRARPDLPGVVA